MEGYSKLSIKYKGLARNWTRNFWSCVSNYMSRRLRNVCERLEHDQESKTHDSWRLRVERAWRAIGNHINNRNF